MTSNKILENMNIEQLIKENKGTIVDVRSRGEFMSGSAAGAINIPLQEIPDRMDEIKQLTMPLILCCASGNRSGQATAYLTRFGIECGNGGPWTNVNYFQSQCLSN